MAYSDVEEIIGPIDNRFHKLGFLALFIFMAILLGLATFIESSQRLKSSGYLKSQNSPIVSRSNRNGILESILVREGDTISQSQTIAVLRNDAHYEEILKLTDFLQVFDSAFKLHDLNPLPLPENSSKLLGTVNVNFIEFKKHIKSYNKWLTQQFVAQKLINLRQRKYLLEGSIIELKSLVATQKLSLFASLQIFESDSLLFKQGVIAETEFLKRKSNFLFEKTRFYNAKENLNLRTLEIKSLEYEIIQIQEGIENQISENRRLLDGAYNLLKGAITQWNNSNLIIAPMDGVLRHIAPLASSQGVDMNQDLFATVPLETRGYYIFCDLTGKDFSEINLDQEVRVFVEGYPKGQFGFLRGKIEMLSNYTYEGKRLIRVEIAPPLVTHLGKEITYIHDMPVNIEVTVAPRSILKRIFYSFREISY